LYVIVRPSDESRQLKRLIMKFYELNAKTPNGDLIKMEDFRGKWVLVVNTATKCGLAPQFDGLEALYQKYKEKGLVVLGFPCNQFLGQEPETNETVVESCRINFGVTFPLTEKIKVNGRDAHPVFVYLKKELKNGRSGRIKWNFTKFLVDPEGIPVKRFSPTTTPDVIEEYLLEKLIKK